MVTFFIDRTTGEPKSIFDLESDMGAMKAGGIPIEAEAFSFGLVMGLVEKIKQQAELIQTWYYGKPKNEDCNLPDKFTELLQSVKPFTIDGFIYGGKEKDKTPSLAEIEALKDQYERC